MELQKTTINYKNVTNLMLHILTFEKNFNMTFFHSNYNKPICKTTHCIAGWAEILSGLNLSNQQDHILNLATYLGISIELSLSLVTTSGWESISSSLPMHNCESNPELACKVIMEAIKIQEEYNKRNK